MQVYIITSGQTTGPISSEQITPMIDAGLISLLDMAWSEGLADWQPLYQVLGVESPTTAAQFFYIPTSRLVFLSLISCGLFNNYWVYKNWKFISQRDGLDIMPFWRGFFCLFHFHSLLKYIKEDDGASDLEQASYSPALLTTGFVIFELAGNQTGITALIAFLFFLPAHNLITAINESQSVYPMYVGWSKGQIFCAAFLPAIFVIAFVVGFIDQI